MSKLEVTPAVGSDMSLSVGRPLVKDAENEGESPETDALALEKPENDCSSLDAALSVA